MQSTTLEQQRFDLRSISPALPITLSVSLVVFTRFKYCANASVYLKLWRDKELFSLLCYNFPSYNNSINVFWFWLYLTSAVELTNLFVSNVALIWVHMVCTLVIFFIFSCRRQTDETISSLLLSLPLPPLHFLQMRSSPTNSLWISKVLRLQTILLLWIKLLQHHGHASLQNLLVGSNRLNIKFCKPGNKSGTDFYCWILY